MERVYLLLGSNLGNKEKNLSTAISLLVTEFASYIFSQVEESSIMETKPFGFTSGNNFANQAITFITSLEPRDVLKVCKYVEQKMGRVPKEPQYDEDGRRIYEDRVIDIDIMLHGKRMIDEPDLKIPHPGLEEREFERKLLDEIFIDE